MKCKTPLSWVAVEERHLLSPGLVDQAIEKIGLIKGRLKAT